MTPGREAVLAELAWLCDEAPEYAQPEPNLRGEGGGWLPFHVRYFRGRRFGGQDLILAMSIDTVKRHLRALAKDGLAEPLPVRGSMTEYLITDGGREALREAGRR